MLVRQQVGRYIAAFQRVTLPRNAVNWTNDWWNVPYLCLHGIAREMQTLKLSEAIPAFGRNATVRFWLKSSIEEIRDRQVQAETVWELWIDFKKP